MRGGNALDADKVGIERTIVGYASNIAQTVPDNRETQYLNKVQHLQNYGKYAYPELFNNQNKMNVSQWIDEKIAHFTSLTENQKTEYLTPLLEWGGRAAMRANPETSRTVKHYYIQHFNNLKEQIIG